MPYDPDDPRLTAYVLGELHGEDREALETLLASDPDASRALDDLRALARMLSESLAAEPAPGLSPDQKRTIAAQLEEPAMTLPNGAAAPKPPRAFPWMRLGLAASALIAVGVTWYAWRAFDRTESGFGLLAFANSADNEEAVSLDSIGVSSNSAGKSYRDRSGPLDTASSGGAYPGEHLAKSARTEAAAGFAAVESETMRQARARSFNGTTTLGLASPPARSTSKPASQSMQSMMAGRGLASANGPAPSPPAQELGYLPAAAAPSRSRSVANLAASLGRDQGPLPGLKDQAGQAGNEQRGAAPVELGIRLKKAEAPLDRLDEGRPEVARVENKRAEKEKLLADADAIVREQSLQDDSNESKVEFAFKRGEVEEQAEQLDALQGAQVGLALPADEPAATEPPQAVDGNRFTPIVENPYEAVTPSNPFSTFSIDVDTASYAILRRYLESGTFPPADAVRIEEMVNYFDYEYPAPSPNSDVPFAVNTEVVRCPWNPETLLMRVGLKGKAIDFEDRKPSNLVFLVDVSGSMDSPDKLPLVKAGLRMLVEQLGENDKIAVVIYAGNSGLALPATHGDQKAVILEALDRLAPGGSTHGSEGINLAYDVAVENFIDGGINRVILATDGDFNVGVTNPDALEQLAAEKAKSGVFLSVLGVGTGNLQDTIMEKIADKGNGNYSYLDSLMEARKVLVEQVGGTLVTIAKDVKIQVDFNPAEVAAFRLVGYENRMLAAEDFNDDTKDAGEIGSGHTVTALYEIVRAGDRPGDLPIGPGRPAPDASEVSASRYAKDAELTPAADSGELLTVRLRYKSPDGDTSTPIEHAVPDEVKDLGRATTDTKFAAAVAEFGMLLRGSFAARDTSYDAVLELARANLGSDNSGRRAEFVGLVEKARALLPDDR